MAQYVIWGVPPGADCEALLVSEYAGISDVAHARKVADKLEAEHGCRSTRVQRLAPLGDGSELAGMFARSLER